jgi:anti-anti-sigma factor
MTFQQTLVGNVLVLTPHTNLVGGDETGALLSAIDRMASGGAATVVLDLGEIRWVSSLGIGLLRKASITCEQSGGWLRLARIGKLIENTLLVTGLIIYFDTFDSVEAAATAPAKQAHRWASAAAQADRAKRPEA